MDPNLISLVFLYEDIWTQTQICTKRKLCEETGRMPCEDWSDTIINQEMFRDTRSW